MVPSFFANICILAWYWKLDQALYSKSGKLQELTQFPFVCWTKFQAVLLTIETAGRSHCYLCHSYRPRGNQPWQVISHGLLGTLPFYRFSQCTLQTITQEHFHVSLLDRQQEGLQGDEASLPVPCHLYSLESYRLHSCWKVWDFSPKMFLETSRYAKSILCFQIAPFLWNPISQFFSLQWLYMSAGRNSWPAWDQGIVSCSKLSLEPRPWCHALVSFMIKMILSLSQSPKAAGLDVILRLAHLCD